MPGNMEDISSRMKIIIRKELGVESSNSWWWLGLAIFLLRSSKLSFVQSRRKAELTHSSNLKAWDSFSLAAASTIIIFVTRLFAITVNCKDILANEPVKSS